MYQSSWLDDKYINLLSFRLDKFKRVGRNIYNFRCPLCGDSTKNRFKARGYVFPSEQNDMLVYKCHNCGVSMSAKNFIKELDQELLKEYNYEAFSEEKHYQAPPKASPTINSKNASKDQMRDLRRVSDLDDDDIVRQIVVSRKIPSEFYNSLYYSTRFMEWINTIIPEKFNEHQLKKDEPRLVIPFYDENGEVFAVTGRSFKKNSIRYLTIKFDESKQKIFGLERVDKTKRIYVVEGPIDSFFIDNSVAFAGSDGHVENILKDCDYVVILDNEPRNKEIVKKLDKLIKSGTKVCIWPEELSKNKDINDMIISGLSKKDIKKIIDNNTYSGLKAMARLAQWKKI